MATSSSVASGSGSNQVIDEDENSRYVCEAQRLPLSRLGHSLISPVNSVVLKVGMVGDSQIGKTSLMVKYVEGTFDEDYIQTLGPCSVLSCLSVRSFL